MREWLARKGQEFPYGRRVDPINRQFRGRSKLLEGYIQETKNPVVLGLENESLFIPAKTRYLDLQFTSRQLSIEDDGLQKVVDLIQRGSADLLDLTRQFGEGGRLQEIDLIAGTTNQTMARLAVRRLGFHYGNPEALKSGNKIGGQMITIFITRDELLRQKKTIEKINNKLKEI